MTLPTIRGFQGENRFLSNFWLSPGWYEGGQYPTAEHAYQASKFEDMSYRMQIHDAARPHDAKIMGQTEDYPLREGWHEGLAYMAMSEVVTSKFFYRAELGDMLVKTEGSILVESNKWHDQKWGDCICGRPECEAPGLNHLGLILMTVRTALLIS